jgi:hypothetical protein
MHICITQSDFKSIRKKLEYCRDKCDEHIMNTWTSSELDDIDTISDVLDEIYEIIEQYEQYELGRR